MNRVSTKVFWVFYLELLLVLCNMFAFIVLTSLLLAKVSSKISASLKTYSHFVTFILVPVGDWAGLILSCFKVCQLRERRLDLEELAEEKKTSETQKKEYDALVKKAKVIDSALKTTEADLEAFQVNLVPRAFPLKVGLLPSREKPWERGCFQVTIHTRHLIKEFWSKNDTTMIEYDI